MTDTPPRPDFKTFTTAAPEIYAALGTLTKAVDASGLEKDLTELVKLRASQLNGCAFCLKIHLGIARKAGVPQEKLDLLAAWRDAGLFSPREQAALAFTEELTLLGGKGASGEGASEATWSAVRAAFSEGEAMHLMVTIAGINAWNRIGIGLKFAPPA